jgi:hypothetical protein
MPVSAPVERCRRIKNFIEDVRIVGRIGYSVNKVLLSRVRGAPSWWESNRRR